MSLLIPIALFGWIPFTVVCFSRMDGHKAVLISYIGAVLFLPCSGYNLPGIPGFGKTTAAGLGVLLGMSLYDNEKLSQFRIQLYDLPVLVWTLCPVPTSLTNQLGLYDGLSGVWSQFFSWGLPYFAGRLYFADQEKLTDLAKGFVIGGIIYVPLCLYEVRMSPQLSNMVYGFFPHSFGQQVRFGGFRPVVFMQHGLPVALWMATTATAAFWLWKSRKIEQLFHVPMGVHVILLILTAILCKSTGAWILLLLGISSYFIFRYLGSITFLQILLLAVPTYTIVRAFGFLDRHTIQDLFRSFVPQERLDSLSIRLLQEDLFSFKTKERFFFGWGGWGRNRPVDPFTGKELIRMIDSLWLIIFSSKGAVGLYSMFGAVLLGPMLAFNQKNFDQEDEKEEGIFLALLGLSVVLSVIDGLSNGMFNVFFMVISGALLSRAIEKNAEKQWL
ncbi:MAG: O-antigen ligase domain-containing protein [Candidatus Electrothrix sp. AW3_4]|nr:O-antigen ligase domain-containing protein [Candidatus Electrothrix gigas]